MSVTTKGKKWEALHSLWIAWTLFTLGLFNWIAFLYIGLRTKQQKWILWTVFYSIPFVVLILAGPPPDQPAWLRGSLTALGPGLWIVSVIHAFWIRKEYLLRLEALQRRKGESDNSLKRRLAAEYGAESRREASTTSPTVSGKVGTMPEHGRDGVTEPSAKEPTSTARTAPESTSNLPKRKQPTTAPVSPVAVPAVISLEVSSGDELEYQISSSYPFPIAFGFRSLRSIVDARDLYREQLRIAENILAFLASVSLALLKEEDREKADVDPKEYWMTGISPGDWKEIVARCSKVFASYNDNSMTLAIKGLNIRSEKKGFGADMAALIRAKNDFKHDRGPVVLEDIRESSREVQEKLKRCMEALAFFTTHPMRQVEDFDVSRRGEGVVLKCLRYTGDHPSFPQEEVTFDRALPRGDLFLDLGQQGWVPLFPFITTMTCSHCKARETYFIDAWDTRKGMARLKSFERGHTMLNKEISDALTEWSKGSTSSNAS